MIQYVLHKKNYIKNKTLLIKEIYNVEELEKHKQIIDNLILVFHSEYQWDDMFTIKDVEDRIKNNHTLFILFYDDIPIGYVFFKPVTDLICFGYNLYVTKKVKRPKYAADWFYNEVSGVMLKTYNQIDVEIEDWNGVVFEIVKNIGYKEM